MHDCCSVPSRRQKDPSICGRCGRRGQTVLRITMESLLKPEVLERLQEDAAYFFDSSPDCEIVYFSNERGSYFTKEDLRVRVGIKETEDPIPICYCFGHTLESAHAEIQATGQSTVAANIMKQIQAGNCPCEVKNPSGRCCLGEVNKAIKMLFAESDALLQR